MKPRDVMVFVSTNCSKLAKYLEKFSCSSGYVAFQKKLSLFQFKFG